MCRLLALRKYRQSCKLKEEFDILVYVLIFVKHYYGFISITNAYSLGGS